MAFSKIQTSTLSILVPFLCISETFVTGQYTNFTKLHLPQGVKGSGGLAFKTDSSKGPFVTTLDGRIMEWISNNSSFVDFAYTSPNRTKEQCDGVENPNMGSICGRPFALTFDSASGDFYIADAYHGVLATGPVGGDVIKLVGGFKFANGVDNDMTGRRIYFSDASLTYDVKDAVQPGFIPDASGRLMRYDDTATEKVSTLLSGLRGGGGPAVSHDGTFVLISENRNDRITKYFLEGRYWDRSGVLLQVNGNPDKITRVEDREEFWVATTRIGYVRPKAIIIPEGVRFDKNGKVLQTVQFGNEYPNLPINMVLEREGKLYVGSQFTDFIGVYSK